MRIVGYTNPAKERWRGWGGGGGRERMRYEEWMGKTEQKESKREKDEGYLSYNYHDYAID